MPYEPQIRRETLAWIDAIVIGLELCPFARAPVEAGRLRLVVTDTEDPRELLAILDDELSLLLAQPASEVETTLIIHPECLLEFDDYLDFLDPAQGLLEARELDGVVQIASFHPDYRFAEAPADDPGNASNRSPYPMLHLLREASVSQAVAGHPDIAGIPAANVAKLRSMSLAQIRALWAPAGE
jgi:uncharacterized protein